MRVELRARGGCDDEEAEEDDDEEEDDEAEDEDEEAEDEDDDREACLGAGPRGGGDGACGCLCGGGVGAVAGGGEGGDPAITP